MGWISVTAVVIAAAFILCALYVKQIAKHNFRCKECSKEFTVNWRTILFSQHYENEYEIKCPHCGHKGCTEISEKNA